MIISELVKLLEETKQKHGDIGVYVPGEDGEESEIRGIAFGNENDKVVSCMICDEDNFDAYVETD